MRDTLEPWAIGVFTSIDAGLGVSLEVARELGVSTIQLHAPSVELRQSGPTQELRQRLARLGLTVTAVFGGFAGESYADIPTTQRTVGLVPAETRAARLREMKEIADFAARIEVIAVGLHLGFIPHVSNAPDLHRQVVAVTQELCDHVVRHGQAVHLETGQETAEDLLAFLAAVDRPNLGINFDPANMVLYGTGEPISALHQVGAFVRSVHCKDALWSERPGETWGREVPLGEGAVGMANFLRSLRELGYQGSLTIEREIPQEPGRQRAEIAHAVGLLTRLRQNLLV